MTRAIHRHSLRETKGLAHALKVFIEHERNGEGPGRAAISLARILDLGVKKRLFVIDALGALLGEALHASFHEGRLSRGEVAELLGTRLETPGAARDLYERLLEKTDGRGITLPDGTRRRPHSR